MAVWSRLFNRREIQRRGDSHLGSVGEKVTSLKEILSESRRLSEKATPNPWRTSWHKCEPFCTSYRSIRVNDERSDGDVANDVLFGPEFCNNLDFIVHLRNTQASLEEQVGKLVEALKNISSRSATGLDEANYPIQKFPDTIEMIKMAKAALASAGFGEKT